MYHKCWFKVLQQQVLKPTMWLILSVRVLRELEMTDGMIVLGRAFRLQNDLDVDEPELPRIRKTPRRYEIGSGEGDFYCSPKVYFKVHYYEALDLIVNLIQQCLIDLDTEFIALFRTFSLRLPTVKSFHLGLTL